MDDSQQDGASPHTEASVHIGRREVLVPVPGGDHVLVDPQEHREDVVRRLLHLGVSTRTLRALLPTWTELILRVAAGLPLDASGRMVGAPLALTPRRLGG